MPTPNPRDLYNGSGSFNDKALFRSTFVLTDLGSEESTIINFWGKVNIFTRWSQDHWEGTGVFWFDEYQLTDTGGQRYFFLGTDRHYEGPASVAVWVGDNGPTTLTPEPGTLALAAGGLMSAGGFALRRRRKS